MSSWTNTRFCPPVVSLMWPMWPIDLRDRWRKEWSCWTIWPLSAWASDAEKGEKKIVQKYWSRHCYSMLCSSMALNFSDAKPISLFMHSTQLCMVVTLWFSLVALNSSYSIGVHWMSLTKARSRLQNLMIMVWIIFIKTRFELKQTIHMTRVSKLLFNHVIVGTNLSRVQ